MKSKFKLFTLLSVLISVGFFSFKASQNYETPRNNTEETIKNELIELTQKDFLEYQNLKSLEDRYQKADEILGKIVTLFLADLGLKLGYKPTQASLLNTACAISNPSPASTPPPPEPSLQAATPEVSEPPPSQNQWL